MDDGVILPQRVVPCWIARAAALRRFGHTGITWGIPGDVEQAYRDVAELGYLGFETFGNIILEWNQRPGSYRQLVTRHGIPTVAAYARGKIKGNCTGAIHSYPEPLTP